jgi:hypothetical protein
MYTDTGRLSGPHVRTDRHSGTRSLRGLGTVHILRILRILPDYCSPYFHVDHIRLGAHHRLDTLGCLHTPGGLLLAAPGRLPLRPPKLRRPVNPEQWTIGDSVSVTRCEG